MRTLTRQTDKSRARSDDGLTVWVGGLGASDRIGRGTADGGDDGVVVGVGVGLVVHGRVVVVVVPVVPAHLRVGPGHADPGTLPPRAGGLHLPAVGQRLRGPGAVRPAGPGGLGGALGEGHLPLVPRLGGFGPCVAPQALGALQAEAERPRAGGVVHLLGGDVDGELGAPRHGVGSLGARLGGAGGGGGVVVVAAAAAGGAQLAVVDAGGGHGGPLGGAGRPADVGGGVGRGVHVLHLERPLQSCRGGGRGGRGDGRHTGRREHDHADSREPLKTEIQVRGDMRKQGFKHTHTHKKAKIRQS